MIEYAKSRIMVVFPGRKGAGPKYAFEMTKALLGLGLHADIILSQAIHNKKDWESLENCEITYIPTYDNLIEFFNRTLAFPFKVKPLIKKYRGRTYDFCYVPMIQPWTYFILKTLHLNNIVTTLHDPIPHKGTGKIFNILCKKTIGISTKIVILSKSFLDYTSSAYRKDTKDIIHIPHGTFLYTTSYSPKLNYISEYNFLFFGRISPYKGIDILLEAYQELSTEYSNISLTIAGSGDLSEYKELLCNISNLNLINQFIPDQEVSSYFKIKNGIVVLPYIEATQSGVIPIAMQERTPIIITKLKGLLEQTENGKYATVTDPTSSDLKNAMKSVIENYPKCKRIADASYDYVQQFSWDKLADRLINSLT